MSGVADRSREFKPAPRPSLAFEIGLLREAAERAASCRRVPVDAVRDALLVATRALDTLYLGTAPTVAPAPLQACQRHEVTEVCTCGT